jgi:hypothetical protein
MKRSFGLVLMLNYVIVAYVCTTMTLGSGNVLWTRFGLTTLRNVPRKPTTQ